jgi:integrase/recombinase XerD
VYERARNHAVEGGGEVAVLEFWPTAQKWLTSKVARGVIDERTAANQLFWLRSFALHVGPERSVRSIKTAEFEEWLATLKTRDGRPYKPGSRNTVAAPIRAFFQWLQARGHVKANPCIDVPRMKVPHADPRALSRSDVERLVRAPTVRPRGFRDRALVLVALSLGLRIVELHRMRVEHWDRDSESLLVLGKGSREDLMPAVGDVAYVLEAWVSIGLGGITMGPMWPSPRWPDQNLARGYIGKLLKWGMAEVGIAGRAHDLRHTAATLMLGDGVPINVVQQFMRHRSLASTEIYVRASRKEVRSAMLDRPPLLRATTPRFESGRLFE